MNKCPTCEEEFGNFVKYEAITWGEYRLDTKEYDVLEGTSYRYYCPSCNEEIFLPIEEN